jgi:2-keto-myo-inositol isomerase
MSQGSRRRVYLNGATIMTTSTADSIRIARAAGFDGVELRAERLLDAPAEVAEAAALVRPGEVWSLNGIQLKTDPAGKLDRELALRELGPRLEICQALGAEYLLVVPPRAAGLDTTLVITAMQEGLELLAERTGRVGVGVAFEFLGFGDCPINTPALAAEVVAGVSGVELVLDSCHWHASGGGSLAGFPVDRLAMVHLNDAPAIPPRTIEDGDRVLPGQGVIRLGQLLKELAQAAYAGPVSLETFNPGLWADDPGDVARRGLAAIRELLEPAAR